MSTYRIVWTFAENNGAGFNEVYYCDGSSPASVLSITQGLLFARLAMLHQLNTFVSARSSDVSNSRQTSIRRYNLGGTVFGNKGPLPVGSAAVLALAGTTAGSRKLWLRGIPYGWYIRNGTTGIDQPPADFLAALTEFSTQLKANGFGLRLLTPAAQTGAFSNQRIISVDGTLVPGQATVTLQNPPGYPFPARVVIGGASKKDLPSLNGHWSLVQAPVGNTFIIPYQTPQAQKINGGAAKVRQEGYSGTNVFNGVANIFDHYGTRTSRSPLTRSRGARRAARIRSSL